MNGKRVGYIRVSSVDQNTDRQLVDVKLDKVFNEKVSGKDTNRPQLKALLDYVREGDTVIVHSMDRLARNLDDLKKLVKTMTSKGVAVEFEKEHLTFTGDDSPMAQLLLNMMGAFAEFERELIKERRLEGIAAAKKRGVHLGRKRTLTAEQAQELVKRIDAGEMKADLARAFGISRETLYQYARRQA